MDIFDLINYKNIHNIRNEVESMNRNAKETQAESYKILSNRIDQLILLNHAMSEIISDKLGITNQQVIDKMMEIDLRDGVQDGKYSAPPKDCPECKAKISREFNRCLFCGYEESSAEQLPI